jgi:hypothetical protein
VYRNDAIVPFFALVLAAALFLMGYLNTQNRVIHEAGVVPHLTVGTIGLVAFGVVLFIYGFIGLLSTWLEGIEMRPGLHQPEPSSLPVVAGVVLALALVGVAGFFARSLIYSAQTGHNPHALQGGLFAAMMLLLALLFAIYKKFFQAEEVLAEDEKSDFPW